MASTSAGTAHRSGRRSHPAHLAGGRDRDRGIFERAAAAAVLPPGRRGDHRRRARLAGSGRAVEPSSMAAARPCFKSEAIALAGARASAAAPRAGRARHLPVPWVVGTLCPAPPGRPVLGNARLMPARASNVRLPPAGPVGDADPAPNEGVPPARRVGDTISHGSSPRDLARRASADRCGRDVGRYPPTILPAVPSHGHRTASRSRGARHLRSRG